MVWMKSTASGDGQGSQSECVEVAHHQAQIFVRDSKTTGNAMVTFSPQAWSIFLRMTQGAH
ncbi:DUF397 domain-containing protein [Streptomyces puniciscabiei]